MTSPQADRTGAALPAVRVSKEPVSAWDRYGGRVLDSGSALRLPGEAVQPTAYVGSNLLVRTADLPTVRGPLEEAARQSGLGVNFTVLDEALPAVLERHKLTDLAATVSMTVARLVVLGTGPASPPDAWTVLQTFRSLVGPDSPAARLVALDHVLVATPDIGGNPFMRGNPFMLGNPFMIGNPFMRGNPYDGDVTDQYGLPGFGARTPVAWVGNPPARTPDTELGCRRPVVAVLDTGAGKHPWLPDAIVDRNAKAAGLPIGMGSGAADGDPAASIDNPLEGTLASDVGHGTFIAGLIRQTCPDANILAVRIMHGDGVVSESDLLQSLNRLLARQAVALAQADATQVIDLVSMSLGYYHESPPDAVFDNVLLPTLRELAKRGVAVVTSAGNDATTRHMYPAAFTPNPSGPVLHAVPGEVPLVSVGALNPSGTSVAMFSNSGAWVSTHRPGAAVISTMPVTLNAALGPEAETTVAPDGKRADIDMDDFTGGFATWSGTSFAAPILAGEIAQSLLDTHDLDTLDATDAVSRGCQALASVTD